VISLSLLCATAMVQPVPVWETRPALVANLHAVSAMRTNVGDVKLTFDIAKTTESVAVRNLDLKLTCHPLHAPDAAPVPVPRDENGKHTELAFPNNPVTIASAYLAWIGWWGVDKLELNETTWFSWEAEGVSGPEPPLEREHHADPREDGEKAEIEIRRHQQPHGLLGALLLGGLGLLFHGLHLLRRLLRERLQIAPSEPDRRAHQAHGEREHEDADDLVVGVSARAGLHSI